MNRIASLRKERGLSQRELGIIIGAAQNTISNWENGNREPDYENLKKLAYYFDCSVDYLLGNVNFGRTFVFGQDSKSGNDWAGRLLSDSTQQAERTAVPKDDGLSPLEAQLMEYIRRLTDDQKKMLLAQIELLLSKQGSRPDSRE